MCVLQFVGFSIDIEDEETIFIFVNIKKVKFVKALLSTSLFVFKKAKRMKERENAVKVERARQ